MLLKRIKFSPRRGTSLGPSTTVGEKVEKKSVRAKKTKGEQRELSGGERGGGGFPPPESTAFFLVYAVHPFFLSSPPLQSLVPGSGPVNNH